MFERVGKEEEKSKAGIGERGRSCDTNVKGKENRDNDEI